MRTDDRSDGNWADANKQHVGTATSDASRVWFSTARGVLTEVFYPTPDQACTRSLELLVAGPDGVDAERAHESRVALPTAPLAQHVSTFDGAGVRIEQEILCDPCSDVVLVRLTCRVLRGPPGTRRVYAVLEPRLGDRGDDNVATIGRHQGEDVLYAHRADGLALALAGTRPWIAATARDGRAQLRAHQRIVERVEQDGPGVVSLTGELALADGDEVVLALAFARTPAEAAHLATMSLQRGYDAARAAFVDGWSQWHARLDSRCAVPRTPLFERSATILKTFEAKQLTGGRVAALATPWGPARGPGSDGTYHLVWTRDLVETVGALVAVGADHEARTALDFLGATQERDGHWPQNMRLDGEAAWNNDELDEVALPILFVDLVRSQRLVPDAELARHWPMVERAAGWIMRSGPATTRDRWEDTSGVTPFSIAAAIAALVAAAGLADLCGQPGTAARMRGVADAWHAQIDTLLYRSGGALATHLGIAGYYVRSRELGQPLPDALDLAHLPVTELSPDALALVRFGLRAADDPRIADTVRAIDAVLRVELPQGPAWRRYPGDEYGEHADGSPYDGHGIGRPWPLLTGERAHYELARGDVAAARRLLATIEGFANAGGCLPEQVWDQADVPARGLYRGGPTGSAAPLGWAHAEYLKLCRGLADGAVFDLPREVYDRYVAARSRSSTRAARSAIPARRP